MFWNWRKKKKARIQPFRAVAQTERLAEYSGSIKSTPFAKHILFCERVTAEQSQVLLAEGFLPVFRGAIATHTIFCVAYLHSFPNNPRLVFNCLLDLNIITGNPIFSDRIMQDGISIRITEKIAKHMQESKDSRFLIRCQHKGEFPHCVKDEVFDQYWLIELGVYYRAEMKRLAFSGNIG